MESRSFEVIADRVQLPSGEYALVDDYLWVDVNSAIGVEIERDGADLCITVYRCDEEKSDVVGSFRFGYYQIMNEDRLFRASRQDAPSVELCEAVATRLGMRPFVISDDLFEQAFCGFFSRPEDVPCREGERVEEGEREVRSMKPGGGVGSVRCYVLVSDDSEEDD